jgi:hypothetical protein
VIATQAAGELNFFSAHRYLHEPAAFRRYLAPVHNTKWVVYAKRPFAGPAQVLDYVGRYTHRVAISNNRLVSMNNGQVSFRWKDYRDDNRQKTMTLPGEESMCCWTVFTASDTTASLATAIAQGSWRSAGNYPGWHRPNRQPTRPPTSAAGSRH